MAEVTGTAAYSNVYVAQAEAAALVAALQWLSYVDVLTLPCPRYSFLSFLRHVFLNIKQSHDVIVGLVRAGLTKRREGATPTEHKYRKSLLKCTTVRGAEIVVSGLLASAATDDGSVCDFILIVFTRQLTLYISVQVA